VGGGYGNTANGLWATIPGGSYNSTAGQSSFAAGYEAKALNDGAFVWSDSQGGDFSSTNNDSFNVQAHGGARFVTGGSGLNVDGPVTAASLDAINGPVGIGTTTPKHTLDVAGNIWLGMEQEGADFTELGDTLYLGSPRKYLSNTLGAPVAGNTDWVNLMAHPLSAGILFGLSGPSDTDPHSSPVPLMVIQSGGNVGIGTTTPAGHLSVSTANGTVSIADDAFTPALVMSGGPAPGILRVRNGLEVWPNTSATAAGKVDVRGTNGIADITLDGGNGQITCVTLNMTSDRAAKENFTAVNPREVLAKVTALPVTQWNYKTDNRGVQHLGPMAQDFQAAFGLDGQDYTHISVIDEGGVALAAIQGLSQKLDEKDAQIKELETSVAELIKLVAQLAAQSAPVKASGGAL
jgi:hypothetical protein